MRSLSPTRMDFPAWVAGNLTVELQTGSEWTCVCPMCGKPKLAVNVAKRAWQCWTCKFAGRKAEVLIAATLELDPTQLSSYLTTGILALAREKIDPLSPKKEKRGVLPKAPLPPGTAPLQGSASLYAAQRGIPEAHAKLFGLASVLGDGSGSVADRLLTGRLLIPVFDLRNRLVYWVARACDGHEIKTFNLPRSERQPAWGIQRVEKSATRSEVLVGLHAVKAGSRVVVVEGPMDAVVCGAGFVATLGASLSVEQAFLIASTGASEAVILYDPDEAGDKGAQAAFRRLSPFMPTRIANCPPDSDPADLGRREALRVVGEAPATSTIPPLVRRLNRQHSSPLGLRSTFWRIDGLKRGKKES